MLVDKYASQTLNDIKLDDKAIDTIIAWINSWNRGLPSQEKPALLLTGFPGTGKTTAARCICNDAEWLLLELNASDSRRKEDLSKFTPERSLMGNITCILFDEADSFGDKKEDKEKNESSEIKEKSERNKDKTGIPYVVAMIRERRFPIILTANNAFKVPKEIKALCESLQIYRPSVNALKAYLYDICKKEGLNPTNDILNAAAQCQDYRMGLSMIENNIILSKNIIKTGIEETVRNLLLNNEANIENPKKILYNLDANISRLYSPLELYETYNILSRVDILRRRGQTKHAITLLKTIPKTTLEEFELIPPIYIERKKAVIKNDNL